MRALTSLTKIPFARKMGQGATLVLLGVSFLTLNERRDVAQAKLRAIAQASCLSVDEDADVADFDGKLIHYQGTVRGDELEDAFLGVSGTQLIKLRRTVQMYQWREKEYQRTTTDRDGNEKTTVEYSYSKVWSSDPEPVKNDPERRNPSFPADLRDRDFVASNVQIGQEVSLNDGLLDQLEYFVPLSLDKSIIKEPDNLPFDLYVTRSGKTLSNGKSYVGSNIGDLRVFFEAVLSGPYTTVAKLEVDGERKKLVPFTAKLKESLGSQAEIHVPDDLNEVLGIELDSFVIPERVIAEAEKVLLALAPLEVNYVGPSKQSIGAVFQNISNRDYETLWYLRAVGTGAIFLGAVSIAPAALVSTGPGLIAVAGASIGMAYKTINQAKPKVAGSQRRSNEPDIEI